MSILTLALLLASSQYGIELETNCEGDIPIYLHMYIDDNHNRLKIKRIFYYSGVWYAEVDSPPDSDEVLQYNEVVSLMDKNGQGVKVIKVCEILT